MAFRTVRVAHYLAALGGLTFLAGSAAAYAVASNFVDGFPAIGGHAQQDPDVGVEAGGQSTFATGRLHRGGAANVASHGAAGVVARASGGASSLPPTPTQTRAEASPNPIEAILHNLPGAPAQSPTDSGVDTSADSRLLPPALQSFSTAEGPSGDQEDDAFQAGDVAARNGETSEDLGFPPDPSLLEAGSVPEPASWGLMMLGFGVAGALMRRRRANLA